MTASTGVQGDWNDVLVPSRRFGERGSSISGFPIADTFEGVVTDPQSLHKYLYVHGDPVNGIDPTGQFFTIIGFLAAFTTSFIQRGIKDPKDISTGATASATFRFLYYIWNSKILTFGALFMGGVATDRILGPLFAGRVTPEDKDYARGNREAPLPGWNSGYSRRNRRVFDMASSAESRERLVDVLEIVRSTSVFAARTNTCKCWVHFAATRIAELPREYWENDDYVIEQIQWKIPEQFGGLSDTHAALRVRFLGSQKVAYFDNGAVGDTTLWDYPWLPGGIFFENEIPDGFVLKAGATKGLDNIEPLPGRLDPGF